ncbi:M20/M25/M40 family metallo-hydrolase [Nonomuraea gerenzanensis]|uniref:Acetylornithine deacetylase n=1 Tax=Nonomuraea gerenzanensis TaxID=93944 RepID=A0A1M4BL15_9ACTN|nr:M20/M25/M40 family metallo-hydrolase [Nonomuraea gerenzanensis]UBU19176.1 M20/M25/M40 family metallo-hydrolase [Nonomuraea gerenzanensis]SAP16377.1 Acetylornithine deacetylase [Nonomuraea gerenzanensis]
MNLSPTELTSQLAERLPIRHSPGVSDALALAGAELARLGLDHDVRPYGDAQQITATHAFSAAGPHVIVNAHIDIEPFLYDHAATPAPREPGRVYGPGTSDMLGGIAATIGVLRGLSTRDDLMGRITVQLVVGAHQGGAGTTALLSGHDLPAADLAVIPEPTGGHVCTAAYGLARYQLRSTGEAGTMAMATDRTNAATHAATALLALNAADQELRRLYPTRQQFRYVLPGLLHAGHDAAEPAAGAVVEFAVALPPLLPHEVALDVVRRHLSDRFEAGGFPLPSWESGHPRFPATDLGHRAFAEVLRTVNPALGWCQYPCPSDARAFQDAGVAVVLYGPGELSRTRRPGEYVEAGELEEFAGTLGSALARWLTTTEARR